MGAGERLQVLRSRLQQAALRVQHLEQAELAQLVAGCRGVMGALRGREYLVLQRLGYSAGGTELLDGRMYLRLDAQFSQSQFVTGLVETAL